MKAGVLLAYAALTLAVSASAQSGRSGMSTAAPLSNVRAFSELRAFGICMAKTQRRNALAVIATVPDSADEAQVLKSVVYGEHVNCLFGGTEMSMPNIFARGAIAEGLLRADGVPAEYQLTAPAPTETKDLHGVARCYVNSHRAEAQALLETRPGSDEETKTAMALWSDFRVCMPGFKVHLNAPWIRFLLAEALLRLPPPTPAGGE